MYNSLLLLVLFYGTIILNGDVYGSLAAKRGIFEEGFGGAVPSLSDFGNSGFVQQFNTFPETFSLEQASHVLFPKPFVVKKFNSAPSPAEIAAAVTAAKQASANVMAAQQRVQVAKEDVVTQQKIANNKEVQAALALQQIEAAVAVQRQQASSAANAVVMAQQRLAQAKSDVAEQQRAASEKEEAAASVIHRSATAAAAEIKKSEITAAKISAIQRSEAAAVLKYVNAAKDTTLSGASVAVAAAVDHPVAVGIDSFPVKVLRFAPWN